jgi:hypothetical protein
VISKEEAPVLRIEKRNRLVFTCPHPIPSVE